MPEVQVSRSSQTRPSSDAAEEESWRQIRESLRGLRYGSVLIIVQDGVIVQIDRTEKRRLTCREA